MKKVSIITATYNMVSKNRKEYFIEMFRSIHEQDYPNIEHVIVDGGSKDGSVEFIEEIINKYAKKEIVFISEKDKGINDATNKGYIKSSGDYITLMCDDDFYTRPDSVSKLLKAAIDNNADFACSDCWWSWGDNSFVWRADPSHFASYNPPCLINTMLIKREVLDKEPYYLPLEYPLAGDWELQFRLLKKENAKAAVVSQPLTILRAGGAAQADYSLVKKEIEEIFYKHFNSKLITRNELYNMHQSKCGIITLLKIYLFCKNKQIKKSVFKTYNKKAVKKYIRQLLEYFIFLKFIYKKDKKMKFEVPETRANYPFSQKEARSWINSLVEQEKNKFSI